MLIPAFVVLSLAPGSATPPGSSSTRAGVDDNNAILDSLPTYPGSREIQRLTQTSTGEDALPVPDEIVTSALYAPPAGATQEEVVAFYVESLAPEWETRTRVVRASGEEVEQEEDAPSSYRVDFSRERRLPQPAHVRHGRGPRRRADLRPLRPERRGACARSPQ